MLLAVGLVVGFCTAFSPRSENDTLCDSTENSKAEPSRSGPSWDEADIVLVSALEHFSYCPRQCGLIHVERVYDENVFTLRGQRAHRRADEARSAIENGVRVERALPIWSDRYGLNGRADVVEFHPDGRVVPVEYKHGPRRESRHDDLQLCAQALCLEEMLGVRVLTGAVFSVQTKRRRETRFGDELRAETFAAIEGVRAMLRSRGPLPPAVNDARCPKCSLFDACVPATVVSAGLSEVGARGERLRSALFVPAPWESL